MPPPTPLEIVMIYVAAAIGGFGILSAAAWLIIR